MRVLWTAYGWHTRSALCFELDRARTGAGPGIFEVAAVSGIAETLEGMTPRTAAVEKKGIIEEPVTDAQDLRPLECLCNLDFWLLFVVGGFLSGAGLVLFNNMSALVQALGGKSANTTGLV